MPCDCTMHWMGIPDICHFCYATTIGASKFYTNNCVNSPHKIFCVTKRGTIWCFFCILCLSWRSRQITAGKYESLGISGSYYKSMAEFKIQCFSNFGGCIHRPCCYTDEGVVGKSNCTPSSKVIAPRKVKSVDWRREQNKQTLST